MINIELQKNPRNVKAKVSILHGYLGIKTSIRKQLSNQGPYQESKNTIHGSHN
jgi:hypothetical protein